MIAIKNKIRIVLVGLGLLSISLLAVVQGMGDDSSMKKLFYSEVQQELVKTNFSTEVFTEEDFAGLPAPIGRYFRYLGFVGQPKMPNAKIVFDEVAFNNGNMDLKLYCEQFNFVKEPTRIAYMIAKIGGVIPFEGRDKYQDGEGRMTGKLAKLFKLFDVTGTEMNQSGLVTILAECLVIPAYAFAEYITWEEIDKNRAKATISYKEDKVSGIFTISDDYDVVTFRSEDRYMDKGKGVFERVPWRAEVVGVREQKGLELPGGFKAIWELPEGDFLYFDGLISSVEYNVEGL